MTITAEPSEHYQAPFATKKQKIRDLSGAKVIKMVRRWGPTQRKGLDAWVPPPWEWTPELGEEEGKELRPSHFQKWVFPPDEPQRVLQLPAESTAPVHLGKPHR